MRRSVVKEIGLGNVAALDSQTICFSVAKLLLLSGWRREISKCFTGLFRVNVKSHTGIASYVRSCMKTLDLLFA